MKALVALAFALVALLVACENGDGGEATPDTTPGATVSPQPQDETPAVTPGPGVCQPNPDPATPDVVEVDSPSADDSVTAPVTVSGRIAASQGHFRITIFDAAGSRIVDLQTTSEAAQFLSPFSEEVPFSVVDETPACIWVYEVSAMDAATPINVVQVPVTLLPGLGPQVCQPNPDPATPEFQVIEQPNAGDIVTSPVTISGQVVAFEGTYQIGVFDADGNPIVETFGMAEATEVGELAPFSIDVAFEVEELMPACIWVYERSARDGSPIHVGQIQVVLLP